MPSCSISVQCFAHQNKIIFFTDAGVKVYQEDNTLPERFTAVSFAVHPKVSLLYRILVTTYQDDEGVGDWHTTNFSSYTVMYR